MYKKTTLVILILGFILIFSSNFISAVNLESELNTTFISSGESDIRPIFEGDLLLKQDENKFGMGLKAVYSDQNFSFYDIFTLIKLDLVKNYNTDLKIGLSQYNGYEIEEEYRGFLLGANIEKIYNINTIFFTNLNFSFFPNASLTKLKTGVRYKFAENTSMNLSYNFYGNKNSGFAFGLSFILDK